MRAPKRGVEVDCLCEGWQEVVDSQQLRRELHQT